MTISIGVQGASGGLGASSLVAALATRAAQSGRSAVCVDHRAGAGGLDVVLGVEQVPGLRWPDLHRAQGRLDGGELVGALPGRRGVRVLAADRLRPRETPLRALTAVRTALGGAVDVVVHDLPATGVSGWPVVARGHDLLLLLGGVEIHQVAAVMATALLLGELGGVAPVLVARAPSFDEAAGLSELAQLPLAAVLRDDRSVRSCLARGAAPGSTAGPLRDAADLVLAHAVAQGAAA